MHVQLLLSVFHWLPLSPDSASPYLARALALADATVPDSGAGGASAAARDGGRGVALPALERAAAEARTDPRCSDAAQPAVMRLILERAVQGPADYAITVLGSFEVDGPNGRCGPSSVPPA